MPIRRGTHSSKDSERPVKGLLQEILKSVLIALLGAAGAYSLSVYRRLPSRSLTILPAGIHIVPGPKLACNDTQFIVASINQFLEPEIAVPSCDTFLEPDMVRHLLAEMDRAKNVWDSDRLGALRPTLASLQAVKPSGLSDAQLRKQVQDILSALEFISRDVPLASSGREQLTWALNRVGNAVNTLSQERREMDHISSVLRGDDQSRLAEHLELYFVVTNASDIEFYFPTRCMFFDGVNNLSVAVEQLGDAKLPTQALAYLPVLPGRGQLIKFAPQDEFHNSVAPATIRLLLAPQPPTRAILNCELPNGTRVASSTFGTKQFTIEERLQH
jgi:hypothetical protein